MSATFLMTAGRGRSTDLASSGNVMGPQACSLMSSMVKRSSSPSILASA